MKFSTNLPLIYHYTETKRKVDDEAGKVAISSKRHQTKIYPCSIFYKPISKLCPLKTENI
jgi:hypothetical protein